MKKFIFSFCLFFCFLFSYSASNRVDLTLSRCVDGDTAKFYLEGKEISVRFLAIDTPEVHHPSKGKEPWGEEASNYTCSLLTNAHVIQMEYDENSDKFDKYDRHLGWIFIDDVLLQEKIVEEGYGKVAYLYGDYDYTSILQEKEAYAKEQKRHIWSETSHFTAFFILGISILFFIFLFLYSQTFRKKSIRKVKRKAKTELKKLIQKHLD